MDKIIEKFGLIFAGAGTLLTWAFGIWEKGVQVLFCCMVLDYLMGWMCGSKEENLSSEIGFNGLKKKFTVIIILILAVMVDRLLGQGWVFRTLVIWFYIGMEGLSILENAVRLGVPFPDALKNILVQLKKGNKKGAKEEAKIE
jgi:toxin secretion/phage lysis holin